MDLPKLHQKLIAIARNNPPGQDVPHAFEKRIMARLCRPIVDKWSAWNSVFGRAAFASFAAMLLVAGWSQSSARNSSEDLSHAFEQTVLAAVDESFEEDLQ